ncbi:hypothetical protein [Streptomyces sp. NPDC048584]|uniref:hypothetical protein n=1 Tax=Streptomyces sp. NPDC048584 TaxID=3365573 RepID=UPI003717EDE3
MSRGEGEKAQEQVTGGEHAAPDGPFPHFTVVISGDGSAAVDGEPVPVADGTAVDAAVLDLLHGHARDLDTTVTAAISDPAAGYVAFVEVSPDGSSSLLEQEPETAQSRAPGDAPGAVDEAAYRLPEPESPPPPRPSGGTDGLPSPGLGGPGPGGPDRHERGLGEPDRRDPDLDEPDRRDPDRRDPAPLPVPPPQPARRTASRQSDDEFEGPGPLSRPLVVGPVALGVAALVIIPLVVLGSGGSDDGGKQEQAAASSSPSAEASPARTSTPLPVPPPSPASPSAKEKTEDKGKDKDKPKPKDTTNVKGGGVTVTVTATPPASTTTVTAKPPQDTAASAVRRLAASDPSGRHICYRAYVSGKGWQKPVCDGTMAGTTGQNRPIKALNIAVHGVDGSAGNAFRHASKPVDGRGEWQPSWTAVTGDGKNFTIGSPKKDAPDMLGFALNVGSGEICNTVRLRQRDWGGRVCTKPRPDFVFGGTLDNDVWLEAVKLTV